MLTFDDRLEDYILSHIDPEPADLHALYRYTNLHCLYPRMCAGHYQGRLLKMLTTMINPQRVLELGTFTGYSTLAIAEGLGTDALIDTVEVDIEKEEDLRTRFAQSPYGGRIRLHIGDALEVIENLEGPFKMVYIDANKRHYALYLEAVYPLLEPGGFVLADNTLWDMKVVPHDDEEPSSGRRKTDSQTSALAAFNDAVAADSRFEKIILPVRDGLSILRKVR